MHEDAFVVANSTRTSNLTELVLNNNRIRSLTARHLRTLTSLTYIDASTNYLSAIANGTFSNNRRLSRVLLNHNKIALFWTRFSLYPDLTEFDLSDNKLRTLGTRMFLGLKVPPPGEKPFRLSVSDMIFRCDCQLVGIREFVSKVTFVYEETTCQKANSRFECFVDRGTEGCGHNHTIIWCRGLGIATEEDEGGGRKPGDPDIGNRLASPIYIYIYIYIYISYIQTYLNIYIYIYIYI